MYQMGGGAWFLESLSNVKGYSMGIRPISPQEAKRLIDELA